LARSKQGRAEECPEIRHVKCDEERTLGLRAKARMEQLATGFDARKRKKYSTLARLRIGDKDAAVIMTSPPLSSVSASPAPPGYL
jgi:hypothetical protein